MMIRLIFIISSTLILPNYADFEAFLNDTTLRAYDNSTTYIVSIEKTRLRKSTKNNQCTGMVVSRQWVTTSCTCLLQMNKDDGLFTWPPAILFRLMAGMTNKKSRSARVRFAIKILYHSLCDLELMTMDVALMKANYPFGRRSFQAGNLSPFPVASQHIDFIEAGLDTFIRKRLTCAVYGWPMVPGQEFEFLMELNVVLVKDDQCDSIACKHVPALCNPKNTHTTQQSDDWNATVTAKGVGFACAQAVNTYPPCAGFDGAPLVCGANVWATVTAMRPCNETKVNDTILMTRLDVQIPFLKLASPTLSSSGAVLMLLPLFPLNLT